MFRIAPIVLCLLATAPAAPAAADDSWTDEAEMLCLALNIYWESRSEPPEGQRAVGHVTLNRVADPDFPDTICAVVHQGDRAAGTCAFSWWCDGRSDVPRNPQAWRAALASAAAVLADPAADPTNGALYFLLETAQPDWAAGKRRTVRIGAHVFYK